ncbi:MAG TPA: hypothetical protein VFU15_04830 [Bacteroidia bacterium]|nr:hypothetical protein [Bacteroidia bacterium]
MAYLKKLFEQFFSLVILILLEIVIAYFIQDSDHFGEFMLVSLVLDVFAFIGSFMVAGSHSKAIRKYRKKLGVHSYTPLFYCIPLGSDNGRIFHAAGLFTKNSLIICKVSNDISHNVVSDFWESIEEDLIHIPFSSIREIGTEQAAHENYEDERRKAYLKDLVRNQTIGRLLRDKQKTIVFTAFIYIVYMDANSQEKIIVFGIGENTSGLGLSALAEPALAGWINNTMAVAEVAAELADEGNVKEEVHMARKVAGNLIARVRSAQA